MARTKQTRKIVRKLRGKTQSSSSGSEISVPASPLSSLFEPSHVEVGTSAPVLKGKTSKEKAKPAPKKSKTKMPGGINTTTGGKNTEDIRKRDPKMALAVEKMLAREQAKTQKN